MDYKKFVNSDKNSNLHVEERNHFKVIRRIKGGISAFLDDWVDKFGKLVVLVKEGNVFAGSANVFSNS